MKNKLFQCKNCLVVIEDHICPICKTSRFLIEETNKILKIERVTLLEIPNKEEK